MNKAPIHVKNVKQPVMKSKQLLRIHYILTRLDTLYFLLVGSTPYLLMLPKFNVVNRAT